MLNFVISGNLILFLLDCLVFGIAGVCVGLAVDVQDRAGKIMFICFAIGLSLMMIIIDLYELGLLNIKLV